MMGYYVSGSGNVRIKKDDLGKAYEAMMALQDRTDLMGGGGFAPNQPRRYWFAWMPENLRTIPNEWFFAAAAPFMSGEFEWTGEDGERWKWMFEDGKMIEWTGVNVNYQFDEEVKL